MDEHLAIRLAIRLYESVLTNAAVERMKSHWDVSKATTSSPVEESAICMSRHASKATLKVKLKQETRHCFYKNGTLRICPTAIEYLSEAYTDEILFDLEASTSSLAILVVFLDFSILVENKMRM